MDQTAPTRPPVEPGATAPAAPGDAEAAAWAAVLAGWDDERAHAAYLASRTDLDGLARAGQRYRDVLAARPGDARALAAKAEILKRATVVGLAMLPRTPPPRLGGGRARRLGLLLLAAWLASALAWLLVKAFTGAAP